MYHVEIYVRVRRACMVEGMSVREASRVFGLHRDTVRKMLACQGRREGVPLRRRLCMAQPEQVNIRIGNTRTTRTCWMLSEENTPPQGGAGKTPEEQP